MPTGGWENIDVDIHNVNILLQALYRLHRVKLISIIDVKQQVVAGMNYKFTIVGDYPRRHIFNKTMAITIFEQEWTQTLDIISIDIVENK